MENNYLSGSIPSEIGSLPTVEWIVLDHNKLSGSIPIEIKNAESLQWLHLSSNRLTGTLPDMFQILSMMKWLYVASNKLSGSIPDSLWDLESPVNLFLENNDLVGSVPDDFCSKVNLLKVDHMNWFQNEPRVKCKCCGKVDGCYYWDVSESQRYCPHENIHKIKFYEQFNITDHFADFTHPIGIGEEFSTVHACLSPTGCYTINFKPGPEKALEKHQVLYSNSLNSSLHQDKCDAVHICGKSFDKHHPRRMILNHITQIIAPDLTMVDSAAYRAICWIMTQDEMFDEYEICDGTILQRYVLMYFYMSTRLQINKGELSKSHTCMWPGVTCESSNNFIEHLRLSGRNLQGTIVTEIGLLTDFLKTFDLSDNRLDGVAQLELLSNMPNLENLNVGNNMLEGELPNNLLSLPKLREFNLSFNSFDGILPGHAKFSEYLGKSLLEFFSCMYSTIGNALWKNISHVIFYNTVTIIQKYLMSEVICSTELFAHL